jgi:Fe-Mn family superoxide dismutase
MNIEQLPYAYNALEPYIDEATMKIHHDKHHQTYFDKYTAAIANNKKLQAMDVKDVLRNLAGIPDEIKQAVINHGGGYYHHNFLWTILKKNVPFKGKVADAIVKKWGSYEAFKEVFTKEALSVFGSGWTWLVLTDKGLEIMSTKNQDSPLSLGKKPLLCIDVWEHAYYLKYQNKRAEYAEAFFHVINWKQVEENYST